MSDTEVGGIKGFLRLDDSDWDEKIERAKLKARELGAMNPTITVDADTAHADEQLALFAARMRAIGAESVNVDVNVSQHTSGTGAVEAGAQAVAAAAALEAAEHGVAEAHEDVAHAAVEAAAAEGALSAAQAATAASAEATAEAHDESAHSAEAAAASQAALAAAYIQAVAAASTSATAQEAVAEAQEDTTQSAATAAASATALAAAQQTSELATRRATIAQMRLNEVMSNPAAGAIRVASARLAADASLAQAAAAYRAAHAEDELSDAEARTAVGAQVQAAAQQAAAASSNTLASSQQKAGSMAGWLATAIGAAVAILPAAAGAATAYAGALTGMAGAAVLAIVGANHAIDAGTDVGERYSAVLHTLGDDLDRLAGTAATTALYEFEQAEQSVTSNLPGLNDEVRELSAAAGQAGSELISGAVQGLLVLRPLLVDGARDVVGIATAFKNWTSGSGLQRFTADAQHDLPQVNAALSALGKGVLDLVGAFRPVGPVVLGVIQVTGQFLSLLADMGPVLPVIAAGAGAAFLGFQAWQGITAIVRGVQTGLTALSTTWAAVSAGQWRASASAAAVAVATTAEGEAAAGAAATTGLLGVAIDFALGPAGMIVGALAAMAAVIGVATIATQSGTKAAADYSSALVQDNNAIGEHTTRLAAQTLQQAGVVRTAKQYGVTLTDLTSAATGNAAAQAKVSDTIDRQITKYEAQSKAAMAGSTGQNAAANAADAHVDALKKLRDELGDVTTGIDSSKKNLDALNSATDAATNATHTQAGAYQMTATAYKVASDAAEQQAAQTRSATEAMQLENDAAGLLSNALTLLNGGALSVAEAQTGVAAAVNQAKDAFKDNGKAIDGNSDAAVKNQQAIQQQVQSAQQMADAQAKATGSTTAGVEAYKQSKSALEGALRAQGSLTPAVQAYIDKLYDVSNLQVKPTKLDVDKAAASAALDAYQAAVQALPQTHNTNLVTEKEAAERAIAALKGSLASVPAEKRTAIEAEIADAQARLAGINAQLASIPRSVTTVVRVVGTGAAPVASHPGGGNVAYAHGGTVGEQAFAAGGTSGGSVWGTSGSAFSDSIRTRLSIGEEVANAQAMSYPGARDVVKAINANPAKAMNTLARSGQAAPAPVNVIISGDGLRDVIRVEIEQDGKRRKASVRAGRQ
jgi:hypothetical protein